MKLISLPSLRLRLLVPSIALIVVATMIPTALRHPSLLYIAYSFDPADIVNNILLYMPLGFALSGSSLGRTLLAGFGLATIAELLQMSYIGRVPSPWDIASNTCGAVLGYLAAVLCLRVTGLDLSSLKIPRAMAAAGVPFSICGAILLVHHRPKADFSTWSPGYHLAVGNELTGERPWAGTISNLQIYPFAMPAGEIDALAHGADPPSGGLVPDYDPHTPSGQPFLSPQQEATLYDALVKRSQLTLLVSLRTSNVEQRGPARIVTYSQDAYNRNFTLAQIGNTLTFRLRTPASGPNGTSPALYSGPILTPNRTRLVAAVYDGRISCLYVDGQRVGQLDLGAREPHLPRHILPLLPRDLPIREIELGAAEALLSGLLALGTLAILGVPQPRWIRFAIGALAGAALGGGIWIFGVSSPRVGVRILLECIAAGLVISGAVEREPASGWHQPQGHGPSADDKMGLTASL